MTLYILQRLASIVMVLVIISIIIFVAIHVLPGSAATLILGEYATPSALKTLEQEMGLDRPLVVQYGAWVRDVLTGRWGESLAMKQPVANVVALRLQNSATLAVAALLIVACTA